jgi:hypothetical protein
MQQTDCGFGTQGAPPPLPLSKERQVKIIDEEITPYSLLG